MILIRRVYHVPTQGATIHISIFVFLAKLTQLLCCIPIHVIGHVLAWADEAWLRREGVYETIGLAWYLYAGALLGQPDLRVLDQLLAQQGAHGGFHTHYRAGEPQLTDPNVETTSLALLALYTLREGPTQRLGLPEAKPNP